MQGQVTAQMIADLKQLIPDQAELDRFVARYAPAQNKRVARVKSEPPKRKAHSSRLADEEIREASRILGERIELMLRGTTPKPKHDFKWRNAYAASNQDAKESNTFVRQREAAAAKYQRQQKEIIQARKIPSATPCFACGAARGGGCKRCA